jgi:hypothetical protein
MRMSIQRLSLAGFVTVLVSVLLWVAPTPALAYVHNVYWTGPGGPYGILGEASTPNTSGC